MKKDLALLVLIAVWGACLLLRNILVNPTHWDEAYPFDMQWRYITLAMLHNPSPSKWPVSKDDHPPMGDYLIGSVLSWSGYYDAMLVSRVFKPFEYDLHDDILTNLSDVSFTVPLILGRMTMAVMGIGTLVLVYSVLRMRFSAGIAGAATALVLTNPLFVQITPRLLLESPLGFFAALSLVCLMLWIRYRTHRRMAVLLAAATGIACALCYLTKINGFITLGAALGVLSVILAMKLTTMRMFIVSAGAMMASWALTCMILFPPMRYNPLLPLQMSAWRLEIALDQQTYGTYYPLWDTRKYRPLEFDTSDTGGKIVSWKEGAALILYRMLWYYDPVRRFTGLPVVGILVAAALLRLRRALHPHADRHRLSYCMDVALPVWGISVAISLAFTMLLDWQRYYYLLLLPTAIASAYGMEALYPVIPTVASRAGRRIRELRRFLPRRR